MSEGNIPIDDIFSNYLQCNQVSKKTNYDKMSVIWMSVWMSEGNIPIDYNF